MIMKTEILFGKEISVRDQCKNLRISATNETYKNIIARKQPFHCISEKYLIKLILSGTLINANLDYSTLVYLELINVACKFS